MSYRSADSLRAGSGRSVLILLASCMTYITDVCTVKKTPDDGQRNCPKHVEFYSKNKFEKLVHLFGFIIRIYHDARSPERQIKLNNNIFYFIYNSCEKSTTNLTLIDNPITSPETSTLSVVSSSD